jgi:hypothetical protein
MSGAFAVAVLLLATSARGQQGTGAPLPPAEQAAPAAPSPSAPVPGEIVIPQYPPGSAPPAAGPAKLDPAAYAQWRREKLSFGAGTSLVVQGADGTPVDRVAFYQIVGRPDLAAKQEDGKRRQIWLIAGGVLVGAAGLIGGIALANSNDAPIVYNTSDPYNQQTCTGGSCGQIQTHTWQTTTGTLIAIVGALGGGVLIALGLVAGNPVTTVDEDKTLVGEYNDLLLQHLQSKSAAPSPLPKVGFAVGSGGGMLQAGWAF